MVIRKTRTMRQSVSGWRPSRRQKKGAKTSTAKWKKSVKRCGKTFEIK